MVGIVLFGTTETNNNLVDRKFNKYSSVIYIFSGSLRLIISILNFFAWTMFYKESFYDYKYNWEKFKTKMSKKLGKIRKDELIVWSTNPKTLDYEDIYKVLAVLGPYNEILYMDTDAKMDIRFKIVEFVFKLINYIFTFKNFILIMDFIVSILSFIHPVFSAVILLVFLLEMKITQDVLRSFYQNYKEFLITISFGVTIILIYAHLGFFFFKDSFKINDGSPHDLCKTLFHCFISILNFGFRGGGGIGDNMNPQYRTGWADYRKRWFYDMAFYALITVIMLNLIFGIIIDTFSSIRAQEDSNKLDQRNKCFICSYDLGTINQKTKRGFEYHIKNEHYMWNYIFYLIYLEKKGASDLSSLESYIWTSFLARNYKWVPYLREECITSVEVNESENESSNLLNGILTKISGSNDILQKHLQDSTFQNKVNKINLDLNSIKNVLGFMSNSGKF